MGLSRSSKLTLDPLSDVLATLGARVTRHTRMEAAGRWALAFPALERLKFVALLRGSHWMIVPGLEPRWMREGDVCLIGRTDYVVASHLDEEPVDGSGLFADGRDSARLYGDEVVGIGGTVEFTADNADFLLNMLPDFLIIQQAWPASGRVATVLALMNAEMERNMMGRDVVSGRLADILLVEAIRAYAGHADPLGIGWLGALSDPKLGRVLRALHADVRRPWTVAEMAAVAGMSRAAFSAAFARRVGKPPLAYLRNWRLTLARAALLRGDATIATIANRLGYSSQSAFGHVYRKAFGTSPKVNAQ